jgi:polyphosphate kinase 2
MNRKDYEQKLTKLHEELSHLQEWVKDENLRVVVVFEGRDAAGKGGVIKALTERVSPRVFRKVALPAPTEREKTQIYSQRYVAHLPAAGEVVIFDRSWYNRAGVEIVMGFCTADERDKFIEEVPLIERMLIDDGIILIKYWLEVSSKQQEKRFRERIKDARKQWKLSPMDLESRRRWYAYSRARDQMMDATDTEYAPWHIVRSDDKRSARLNCISHFLSQIPYKKHTPDKVTLPERDEADAYDDAASMKERRYIPDQLNKDAG